MTGQIKNTRKEKLPIIDKVIIAPKTTTTNFAVYLSPHFKGIKKHRNVSPYKIIPDNIVKEII